MKMYLPLLKAIIPFYYLFCFFMIYMGSMPDYTENIDGVEIKNICDLVRNYVMDDSRDAFGPITLMMISPFLIIALWKKLKSWLADIVFIVIFAYWIWAFYIQYIQCS